MIRTTGNVIALVALLSGIHAHFENRPTEASVELVYGDHQLSEQFIATSDKMLGEVRIYIEQDTIYIKYAHEGATYFADTYTDFDPLHRGLMRKCVIELLNGTVVIDVT